MRKVIAFFASIVFASAAWSAPPSPESIETLFTLTKQEKLLDSMYAYADQNMRQSMLNSVRGQQLSAEQRRVLDAMPAKFTQVLREEMTWGKLRPLYVQLYLESFTQEEVDGLIGFYNSPAGLAYIEKMPVVMEKSMTMMQSLVGPMMAKLNAAMQQSIAEAKAVK